MSFRQAETLMRAAHLVSLLSSVGKVVKVNFQRSSQRQHIIYLCLRHVLAISAPPLAVQLAQVSQQQRAAMWLWAV